MSEKSKWLRDDRRHCEKTHQRWIKKLPLNRDITAPDCPEAWLTQQCGDCMYYVGLAGRLGSDWGVCTHEKSALDARPIFEHDGCELHEKGADFGA